MNADRVMHTPTQEPWRLTGTTVYALNDGGTNRFSASVQQGFIDSGSERTSLEELEANARLMAAAPRLLEALQSIVASLAEHDDEGMIEHAEQMIAARTAITEATGEQP